MVYLRSRQHWSLRSDDKVFSVLRTHRK